MFVLLALGSGIMSGDGKILKNGVNSTDANWNNLGLLLRLSLAAPLVIGGMFGSYAQIATFATYQPILLVLGIMLVLGVRTREASVVVGAVMVWFMFTKINLDKSVIANLNGFKREFAFLAAAIVITMRGSGNNYTPKDILNRIKYAFSETASPTAQPG